MKKLLHIIAMACAAQANAQTIMKYYTSNWNSTAHFFDLPGHSIFGGLSGGSMLLDQDGNISSAIAIGGDSILVFEKFKILAPNRFYFVANYLDDPCGDQENHRRYDPILGLMDSLGNVLQARRYRMDEGCQNRAMGLEVLNDGGAMAWGQSSNPFMIRTDASLNLAWSRQIDHVGELKFIKELPSGDLLAGTNMDTAGATIARIDANGNMLWSRSYFRPDGLVYDCVVEDDNSVFVLGVTDRHVEHHPALFVMKLSGIGEVQWCRGYEGTGGWAPEINGQMVKTPGGTYAVVSSTYGVGQRPVLMQLNSNGDTLWTRWYGAYQGYSYETLDLVPCADGGMLLSGICYGDFGLDMSADYLLKVDALGNLACNEQFPPTINLNELFPTDSSFALAFSGGAISLPVGFEVIDVDPVSTIDGCTITSISGSRHSHGFLLRPNPTSGHFTVSFPDPLTAESYYSVYDTSGRLLYQRPLPTGQLTEEVDLSRFGKGTYLLKVTAPEGVCYERVVVE